MESIYSDDSFDAAPATPTLGFATYEAEVEVEGELEGELEDGFEWPCIRVETVQKTPWTAPVEDVVEAEDDEEEMVFQSLAPPPARRSHPFVSDMVEDAPKRKLSIGAGWPQGESMW